MSSSDVEVFWSAVDAELASVPAAPELEPMPLHSLDTATLYFVRLTSIGPYRISGYYSVPRGVDRAPGLLLTPRYGSVNHIPDFHDRERYAVLQLIHRGQRLADQPFAAEYPGLLTLGIDSPDTYIYRGIVADCLRGLEFLRGRPEVGSVAVQGDDLALITAARRPEVAAVLASDLLLYRLLDAATGTEAYPVEEVNDYLRAYPDRHADVARTLSYFDPREHVGRIRATTMLVGGDDTAWLQPLREGLGAHAVDFQITHRGAEDHDALDAWLAGQLGSEPRSRFLQNV
ncbi:MAG TPA: acetylxylan esterase [Chloroflexota bacterium]